MRMVQKYVVLLRDKPGGQQIWLAYDCVGRVGNARHEEAFRYDTHDQARLALRAVRKKGNRWADAEILATLVEEEDRPAY